MGGRRLCGCVNFPLLYANGFSLASSTIYKPHKGKDKNETLSGTLKNGLFTSASRAKKKDKRKKTTMSLILSVK